MIPTEIVDLLKLGKSIKVQKEEVVYEVQDELLTYLIRLEGKEKWEEVSFVDGEEFLKDTILYILLQPEPTPEHHSEPIAV